MNYTSPITVLKPKFSCKMIKGSILVSNYATVVFAFKMLHCFQARYCNFHFRIMQRQNSSSPRPSSCSSGDSFRGPKLKQEICIGEEVKISVHLAVERFKLNDTQKGIERFKINDTQNGIERYNLNDTQKGFEAR